jgi:hypothetical protein
MFDFEIRPDHGEPYKLTAESRDVLVWEKTGRGRSLKTLTDNVSLADMYEISHIAARRQGFFNGNLGEWEKTVNLDLTDSGEPDPTQSAASPDGLSS